MKKLILCSVLCLGLGSVSFADDSFVPSELGLSKQCSEKIVTATIRKCNEESKASEGEDRMHPCIEGQTDVKSSADFELGYTAGDADEYWYEVEMSDKDACKFTVRSEQ